MITIKGDYTLFAHLETVYLGCLARRSLVMRNVREVVEAAGGKPILFFPARHDHWWCRPATAGRRTWPARSAFRRRAGVLVGRPRRRHRAARADRGLRRRHRAAAREFADRYGGEMNVTVLVDFDNDSCHGARGRRGARRRAVGRAAGHLRALATLACRSDGRRRADGVGPSWCEKVRATLDAAGLEHVQIVVSGGFTAERIRAFEAPACRSTPTAWARR